MFPDRVVIATRNPGKVREILRICADWPVAWVTYQDASWPDVEETGASYQENARLKALVALEKRYTGAATAVEVLYTGRDPFTQKLFVNKGSKPIGLNVGAKWNRRNWRASEFAMQRSGLPYQQQKAGAYEYLSGMLHAQAQMMAFSDTFIVVGVVALLALMPAAVDRLGQARRRHVAVTPRVRVPVHPTAVAVLIVAVRRALHRPEG